jgi:hypothetical protein
LLGTNALAYFVGVSGAKKTEWHYQINYGEAKYFYVSVNEQQNGGFGLGQVTIQKKIDRAKRPSLFKFTVKD